MWMFFKMFKCYVWNNEARKHLLFNNLMVFLTYALSGKLYATLTLPWKKWCVAGEELDWTETVLCKDAVVYCKLSVHGKLFSVFLLPDLFSSLRSMCTVFSFPTALWNFCQNWHKDQFQLSSAFCKFTSGSISYGALWQK